MDLLLVSCCCFLLFFSFSKLTCSLCSTQVCGEKEIKLPFSPESSLEPCRGAYLVRCSNSEMEVRLEDSSWHIVKEVNYIQKTLIVINRELSDILDPDNCNILYLLNSPLHHFAPPKAYQFKNRTTCSGEDKAYMQGFLPEFYNLTLCRNYSLHFWNRWKKNSSEFSRAGCDIEIPRPRFEFKLSFSNDDNSLSLLSFGFSAHLKLLKQCFNVHSCTEGSSKTSLKIGLSAGGVSFVMLCFLCFLLYRRWKKSHGRSSNLRGRNSCFVISSKQDPELGSALHPPIFSYDELCKATDGFSSANELGDGGFGTVYKGKLKDGRVVAVKRLYKNNYRRLEQFMNEVKILSLLRHQNLVSLYGCTSSRSCELLLVYEFVPNGTVADHLHGSHSSETLLPWHVRMSIAIETADALNYLHSVEPQIIHRDVKTNNILLDKSFHVKVADFGLSRLFPPDATHVSTAPQGTPGYVDPEYHQCFQLTDKSDVYSFGVVLMELISSKTAVDISRDRNEVNLANFAMKKIQKQELHEFVDQRLGYHSDCNVNRMITMVAALAFRCLQADRETRPAIKEVLEILRGIEGGVSKNDGCLQVGDDAGKEEASLLKSVPPYSPNSVTEAWMSTTSSMSRFSE